jgi:methylenetetrahydrofolate reductase (NADPH)
MKIKNILKANDRGFALEFFPPKNPQGKDAFLKTVKDLQAYGPLYASVTYGAGGTTQDRTFDALQWLRQDNHLTLMSHLTGIGATRDSLGAVVDRLEAMGIDNVLALRGDLPKDAAGFDTGKGDFPYAKDLVAYLRDTGLFSLAVAVYPEGHPQSPSLEKDLEYTKEKIDAGADFAITQMFFDNDLYYRFLDRVAKAGITIPIIPGIMPIVDCKRIKTFAAVCSATIPRSILDRLEPMADLPEESRKLGVEFAIKQVEDLLRQGTRYVHFYSMNRSDSLSEILNAVGPALHLRKKVA